MLTTDCITSKYKDDSDLVSEFEMLPFHGVVGGVWSKALNNNIIITIINNNVMFPVEEGEV